MPIRLELFKRESPAEKAVRISEEALAVVRMKWTAYKAIMANEHATFSIGDPKLYKSVRKRLKGMFHGDMEKVERFKYIKHD